MECPYCKAKFYGFRLSGSDTVVDRPAEGARMVCSDCSRVSYAAGGVFLAETDSQRVDRLRTPELVALQLEAMFSDDVELRGVFDHVLWPDGTTS